MPVTPRIAPKGQQAESFESPYRTETSFKNFSKFLNRPLTIHSRQPSQFAKFSLLDILKHIDMGKAILKGSAASQWKNNEPLADIDLQLPCTGTFDKNQLSQSILEFLNQRSNQSVKAGQEIREKTWFSRVRHDLKNSWVRLIISVGYPAQSATTLDINVTNYRSIAHDVIHASQALQFDWVQRKTFNVGSWHPNLVDLLKKNQLLWFNPDIDEGLGRLSYRLSKSAQTRLLQPEITTHFYDQAPHGSICDIYMRVLMNEYPGHTLSIEDKQQLWTPIVAAAVKPDYANLKSDLLAWSDYTSPEEICAALAHPDTQVALLEQLTKACQIGIDFKQSVKNLLLHNKEFSDLIKPLIDKALGATLVSGDVLFKILDDWNQIQDIPKHELQTVFTDFLTQASESQDANLRSRASNMLGWLNGDELSTLKFWLDRIPESASNNPSDKSVKPVIQAVLKTIKTQGVENLEPALSQLGKLRIPLSSWHLLVQALGDSRSNKTYFTLGPSEDPILGFMHILTRQSAAFQDMTGKGGTPNLLAGKPASTQNLYQACYKDVTSYIGTLEDQQIPPMLRNILSIKADGAEIALPGMTLTVSRSQAAITANAGTTKHWVTEHSRAKLKAEHPGNAGVFYMEWNDGSLFSGQTSIAGKFVFDGVLTHISLRGEPPEVSGLLNTGRALCKSRFPNVQFDRQSWSAKGQFNGKLLLKSKALGEALLAVKQGTIVDQLLNRGAQIEHEIENNTPVKCTVTVDGDTFLTRISARYRPALNSQADRIELQNVWGVEPVMEKVESVDQMVSAPFGIMNLATTLPWDEEKQVLQGRAEIKGSGLVKFKWSGEFRSGELLPEGGLYLDKQKIPAIVFNEANHSSSIPHALLPVMADLLGQRLNGSYTFSPVVWHDQGRWPIPGFEGFINDYTYDDLSFSGYLNSMGRAVGILRQAPKSGENYYSAWAGSFYVRPTSLLNYQPVGLDKQDASLVCVPLSANQVLTPHGFVREYLVKKQSHEPNARIDRIYFCGEGMSLRQITQNPELTYDSPSATRYLVGIDYTLDEKPKHLDLVFNPTDGGNDFFIIRPKNYDQQSNYQEIYRDALGTSASWLVVNREYRMVNAVFPSGMEYSGKIERQGDLLRPTGAGKLSFHGLSFSADFEKDNTIKNVKALNSATTDWLANKKTTGDKSSLTLNGWISLISDGRLDWNKDLQDHFKVRNLKPLKKEATMFSRT